MSETRQMVLSKLGFRLGSTGEVEAQKSSWRKWCLRNLKRWASVEQGRKEDSQGLRCDSSGRASAYPVLQKKIEKKRKTKERRKDFPFREYMLMGQ
jgi:hypothetical protein